LQGDADVTSATLEAEGITKRFGELCANEGVNLTLTGGEVHALLGQNGAGKSTLVGVLTGRLEPDRGVVRVDDGQLLSGGPKAAAEAGVATVFQDLMLVPSMTALENIAFALGLSASRATRRRIEEVQDAFELSVALDERVEELELSHRQRVELLRALTQRPRFLLLDEPTSLLPPAMVEHFLERVRELANRGLAVLLITHRLEEARRIADRITILRSGRVVGTFDRRHLPSSEELAVAMVGAKIPEGARLRPPSDTVLLEAEGIGVVDDAKHEVVRDVTLAVRAGEIVGVAGVDGNGQLELLEAIAGYRRSTGRVRLARDDLGSGSYEERWRRGIHFVSGDRRRDGVVPTLTVAEHFTVALGPGVRGQVAGWLADYDVRPADPEHREDQLSGGNQQKMIVARACERDAQVLLLSYPTQGLDVQAMRNVHDVLVEQAGRGKAVVFVSSDLHELLEISHRVLVMSRGRIVGEQARGAFDERQLAEWYTS
jgi:simple sugar transport system ATP-binding protein